MACALQQAAAGQTLWGRSRRGAASRVLSPPASAGTRRCCDSWPLIHFALHGAYGPSCAQVPEQELRDKTAAVAREYGHKVDFSRADLRKPQEIR